MRTFVLGRLYDAAAILPGKLDARLRRMAALVNGGLTAENLDPAYKAPITAFTEGWSRLTLQARIANTAVNPLLFRGFCPPLGAGGALECWLDGVTIWAAYRNFEPMSVMLYGGALGAAINLTPAAGFTRVLTSGAYPGSAPAGNLWRARYTAPTFAAAPIAIDPSSMLLVEVGMPNVTAEFTAHASFSFRVRLQA